MDIKPKIPQQLAIPQEFLGTERLNSINESIENFFPSIYYTSSDSDRRFRIFYIKRTFIHSLPILMEIIRNLQNSLTTPGSSLTGRDKGAFGIILND